MQLVGHARDTWGDNAGSAIAALVGGLFHLPRHLQLAIAKVFGDIPVDRENLDWLYARRYLVTVRDGAWRDLAFVIEADNLEASIRGASTASAAATARRSRTRSPPGSPTASVRRDDARPSAGCRRSAPPLPCPSAFNRAAPRGVARSASRCQQLWCGDFDVAHVLFVAVRRPHTEREGFRHERNVAAE